jgi:hypothetical protein
MNETPYDEYLDAIIDMRKRNVLCDACGNFIRIDKSVTCEHPNNGYCALFRAQAEKDAVDVGMYHDNIEKT